jgi:hypothetical protein
LPVKLNVLGINWNPGVSTAIVSNSEMRLENATTPFKYTAGTYDATTKTCT